MNSSSASVAISVIIPVYNGGLKFRQCLTSVKALCPSPIEVIVVGDGDTDGSSEFAEEIGMAVARLPSPGGPARARNIGASRAKGEIVFFVDADVTLPSDAIGQVASLFQQDSHLSALFGSYDDHPGEPSFLSQYRNLLHHYVHQHGREEASTFWGACGAIRRNVFIAIGGFDDRYRKPSIEDIELGYRLRKAGHNIRLCKSLQVKHLKQWTVASMLTADMFQRAIPWTELMLRDRNCINDLNTGMSGRASVMGTFVLVGALLLAPWYGPMLAVAGVMAVFLLVLNAGVYGFFLRKRGLLFVLRVIPWHWFYFFYGGLGFLIGLGRHLLRRHRPVLSKRSVAPQARPPASRSEFPQ